MKMNKIIAAFALALCITTAAAAYSDGVQTDLQSNIIRLHIIANSDSDEDQDVKLKIRDAVLEEVGERLLPNEENGEENNRLSMTDIIAEAEMTANQVLSENGFEYRAHAVYGKFSFPEKSYKSITLPAGEYYGIRIVLGKGEGHNWWCVMYPPLCFSEGGDAVLSAESEKMLREKLDDDTYDVITGKNEHAVVKFKIVEIIQNIKNSLK
jgi:stage II sporulation protein R